MHCHICGEKTCNWQLLETSKPNQAYGVMCMNAWHTCVSIVVLTICLSLCYFISLTHFSLHSHNMLYLHVSRIRNDMHNNTTTLTEAPVHRKNNTLSMDMCTKMCSCHAEIFVANQQHHNIKIKVLNTQYNAKSIRMLSNNCPLP